VVNVTNLQSTVNSLQNSNVTPPISAINVNYEDGNDVVKTVEVSLRELDDHITFLNDHVSDLGELETTVIEMKTAIPTLQNSLHSILVPFQTYLWVY
jgi:hypothetical protein